MLCLIQHPGPVRCCMWHHQHQSSNGSCEKNLKIVSLKIKHFQSVCPKLSRLLSATASLNDQNVKMNIKPPWKVILGTRFSLAQTNKADSKRCFGPRSGPKNQNRWPVSKWIMVQFVCSVKVNVLGSIPSNSVRKTGGEVKLSHLFNPYITSDELKEFWLIVCFN